MMKLLPLFRFGSGLITASWCWLAARLRLRRHRFHPLRLAAIGLLLWSVGLGWGIAQAQRSPGASRDVDWVSPEYQVGQQIYIENCSSCHVTIPPEVFPPQTWQQLISTPQHYGVELEELTAFDRQVMWRYLRAFSRSLYEDEPIPYRFGQSRFFNALHPNVEFAAPPTVATCVQCHPGANQRDFRSLSAEWQDEE